MNQASIPEKLYFKIGEVSKIVGVKPYVLRYWETEFKELGPLKSRSKQRLYRRKDVETLLSIKQLLYEEGFTISGARKKIKGHLKSNGQKPAAAKKAAKKEQMQLTFADGGPKKLLQKVKKELEEVHKLLNS